jgi:hypothetical protein
MMVGMIAPQARDRGDGGRELFVTITPIFLFAF